MLLNPSHADALTRSSVIIAAHANCQETQLAPDCPAAGAGLYSGGERRTGASTALHIQSDRAAGNCIWGWLGNRIFSGCAWVLATHFFPRGGVIVIVTVRTLLCGAAGDLRACRL